MSRSLRLSGVLLAISSCLVGAARGQLAYDFTIVPAGSGLDADIDFSLTTAGTLIGNYDMAGNPTGTRTKPGLFGSFGDTENVAVPMMLGAGLGGHPQSSATGSFSMQLDPMAGALVMTGYGANLLASGSESLPATLSFETDSFRTRSPSSTFIGGIPIELPIGDATISSLTLEQAALPANGTLTPMGTDHYSFVVAPIVTLSATVSLLGTDLPALIVPLPIVLQGEIALDGATATLLSMSEVMLDNALMPNQVLPQFPFDLPTILPPGDMAHLLLDLTLSEIGFALNGAINTRANGVRVPEPGMALLVLLTAGVAIRQLRA